MSKCSVTNTIIVFIVGGLVGAGISYHCLKNKMTANAAQTAAVAASLTQVASSDANGATTQAATTDAAAPAQQAATTATSAAPAVATTDNAATPAAATSTGSADTTTAAPAPASNSDQE